MVNVIVDTIGNMAEWVRDISPMEVKVGSLLSQHCNSMRTTISRINAKFRDDGKDLWIKHWFNKPQGRLAILLITRTEHEETIKNIALKKRYEKELPQKFLDKGEYWPVGSWHR